MAIAVIEKATLIIPKTEQEPLFRLLQSFQRLELIDTSAEGEQTFENSPGEIAKWEEALHRIEKAQVILSSYLGSQTFQKLKNGRPIMTMLELEINTQQGGWEEICAEVLALDEKLDNLRNRRTQLCKLMADWMPWTDLSFDPEAVASEFNYTDLYVGILNAAEEFGFLEAFHSETAGLGHFESLFHRGEYIGAALFFPKEKSEDIKAFCKQYDFSPYHFPFDGLPADMLEQWRLEEAGIVKEEANILEKLETLSPKKETLDLAEEFFSNLILRTDAHKFQADTLSTIMLSGWIAKEDTSALINLLKQEMNQPYSLQFSAVEKNETHTVPIILKNKKTIRAFESLTEMYSMPAYDEIDPTPVMTPFYLVFFGMMVADIGYGVVLLLATLFAKLWLNPDKPLKKSIDFFFYLSFPVIAWGAIYGSLFGISLPFTLLSPTTDIIPILILSLVFGWMQLMTGLAMNVYVKLKKDDVLGAFSSGISWMALLLGLALLVISKTVFINNILFLAGIVISVLAVMGIVLFPIAENKGHRAKGLMKGLYALYGATGYVGDLVSYTRLMALGVAGSSIAVAFNTIIASLPLPARVTLGILLAVVLHGLNLFLSMLGAYVHGIRLQYVEFFGKFYGGGGRKFSPFKTAEKHIYIHENASETTQKTEDLL